MFMMAIDNFQVSARLEPKDADAQEIYLRVPETKIREVFDVLVFNGATTIHMERSSHAFTPKHRISDGEQGDDPDEADPQPDQDTRLTWG